MARTTYIIGAFGAIANHCLSLSLLAMSKHWEKNKKDSFRPEKTVHLQQENSKKKKLKPVEKVKYRIKGYFELEEE